MPVANNKGSEKKRKGNEDVRDFRNRDGFLNQVFCKHENVRKIALKSRHAFTTFEFIARVDRLA
jgi:hypothetical protein